MILGIATHTYTSLHVLISLIGMATGFITVSAMLSGNWSSRWNTAFLVTTIATSVTGFFFHTQFGAAHVIGIISLTVLAVALWALYHGRLVGWWRATYVSTAILALYLNVFVGVVQAFQKLPLLARLAPTQSEPPFLAAQTVLMVVFIAIGVLGIRRFRPTLRFQD